MRTKAFRIKKIPFSQRETKNHAIGWGIFMGIISVLYPPEGGPLYGYILLPIVEYLWPVAMFYTISLYILPTLWRSRKYLRLLFVLFILYIVHIAYYYIECYYFLPWLYNSIDYKPPTLVGLVRSYTWWYIYFGIGVMIFAYYRLITEELIDKNTVEQELAQAQNRFLRSQFNPHFLFNVLNFIYDKALHTSEELPRVILLLSDRMRYSLQTGDPLLFTKMEDEIDQVKNYIELCNFRSGGYFFVNIDVEGNISQEKILPRILVSLLEYTFQFGDKSNPNLPFCVSICIDSYFIYITMRAQRKLNTVDLLQQQNDYQTIVGRLNEAYGNDHKLTVDNQHGMYICKLQIRKESNRTQKLRQGGNAIREYAFM